MVKITKEKIVYIILLIFSLLFHPFNISSVQSQPITDNHLFHQFSSNGSLLDFRADGVSASNGSTLYQVSFVGNLPATPVADNPVVDKDQTALLTGKITYPDLWPGITLVYAAPEGTILRSTYHLQPHADPAQIQLAYNHPVSITEEGQLLIDMNGTTMRESAPLAWQMVAGAARPVQVAFKLLSSPAEERPLVGFELGAYNDGIT